MPGQNTYFLTVIAVLAVAASMLMPGCELPFEETPITPVSNPAIRAFEGRLAFPVGEAPYEVLSADLNGDGMEDLVTLNWLGESVSVLLGKVNGFQKKVDYPVGQTPRSGVAARLTADGILSLAVLSESLEQITVLFGDGQGTFPESGIIPLTAGSRPVAMASADFNLDGVADLVVANSGTDNVSIVYSQGNKFFDAPLSIPVGKTPAGIYAGDINRDGIPEILVANSGDDTVSIISLTASGYEETAVLPCPARPRRIQCADVNQDGILDICVSREFSPDVAIFYGSISGAYYKTEITYSAPVSRFVVAELTSDAFPDFAAILFMEGKEEYQPSGAFEVLQGGLSGTFKSLGRYGTGWGSNALIATDMNRDGRADLVTADLATNMVSLIYNRGNGSFQTERHFAVPDEPGEILLADFTQDAFPDLVVTGRKTSFLYLFTNLGDASFTHTLTLGLGAQALALAAGDLNGDGKTDLVVSLNQQFDLLVYINSGNGKFMPAQRLSILGTDKKVLPQVRSIALGDVNGDGTPDIVTANSKVDSVSVLLNSGNAVFQAAKVIKVDNYPLDLHLLDTNRDQKMDLVFLSRNDPESPTDSAEPRVCRWFGKGDGTFDLDSHIRITTGAGPRALRMGDYTGEGNMDCATIHPGDNSLYLLNGGSNGNFAVGKRFPMGIAAQDMVFVDVKKDGKADMLCTNDQGSFYLRFSRGADQGFEGANNYNVRPGIGRILAADLNNDLFPDALLLDRGRKAFYVLRGCSLQ
ncbi:MAG TPA: VCBS repeat-containing protein [Candidatus Hydrogenedentes bacterium]|nr:VCBS repeat-containing protein [Candidatus Hydrogenedentota bacterium]